MNTVACLVLFMLCPMSHGLKQVMITIMNNVHMDSVRGTQTSVGKLDKHTCSVRCLQLTDCQSFYVTKLGECILIKELMSTALVTIPKTSTKALDKIYIKDSFVSDKKYPHFFVVHSSGIIEDFSVDPQKSPPILTYPTFNSYLGERSAHVVNADKSLTIFEEQGKARMFSWNFDDQNPVLLSSTITVHGLYPSFATQNGRMFMHSGKTNYAMNLVDFWINGAFKTISKPPMPLAVGCAAFVPGYDNFVYFGGGESVGRRERRFFEYDIAQDSYKELASPPTPGNNGIAAHECVGAIQSSSKKRVIMLMGGVIDNYGGSKLVYLLDIDANSWTEMSPMAIVSGHITSVFVNGYVYVFGGSSRGNAVDRIEPEFTASWEFAGSLGQAGDTYAPLVVPYNT